MNAAMGTLRDDVHKEPEQLEREADSARSALEGTLAELEHKLSPGEMLDRVMDVVKRNGGDFGDNLLAQVRNNPLPTILAGVGMAWLMAASKRPPPRHYARGDNYDGAYSGDEAIDATESWSSAASAARDRAASTFDSASSMASDAFASTTNAAHRAADAASHAADRAAGATRHAADRVVEASRTSMRGVSDGYAYLCREQPFVLGALGVAAGAALGALFPSTPVENDLLGATSDAAKSRMKNEAQARAGGLAENLEGAAADAIDAAKRRVTGAEPRDGGAIASAQ